MGKSKPLKDDLSSEEGVKESRSIVVKYPERVPVIVDRYSGTDLPKLENKKYLVPREMTVGHFIHTLSKRLQLDPSKALFVFVKNTLPKTAARMDEIYNTFKDEDGFLYMCYSTEKTFG